MSYNHQKIIVLASSDNTLYPITQSNLKGIKKISFKNELPTQLLDLINTADITARIGCDADCGVLVEIQKGSYSQETKSVSVTFNTSPFANNASSLNSSLENSNTQLYVNFNVVNAYKLDLINSLQNQDNSPGNATPSKPGYLLTAYDNLDVSNQITKKAITTDAEAIAMLFEAIFGDQTTVSDQRITGAANELRKKKIIKNLSKIINQIVADENAMVTLGNNLGITF